MFISNWGTQIWFWDDLEAWQEKSTRPFDCGNVLSTYLVLKLEDQDQTQDGDEV